MARAPRRAARRRPPRAGGAQGAVRPLTILGSPMRSRVIWRRSATAIGVRTSRPCSASSRRSSRPASSASTTTRSSPPSSPPPAFFQQLLDLTIEEALVKFGFRYIEARALGAAAAPVRGRARLQARRRPARRRSRSSRSRRSRRRSGAPAACVRADADRVADPARAGARERRRRRDHPARPLRRPRRVPRRLDGAAAVGLAIGCRYGVVGAVIGHGRRAGDRDGGDRRRRASPPSAASRGRRPSRSATTCARSRSFLISSTLASSLDSAAATLGTVARADASRRSSRPATSANAQAPATGFAALSGAGAARDADRADARLRGGPHDRVFADAPPLRRQHGGC